MQRRKLIRIVLKYIIIDNGSGEKPIIFDVDLVHLYVAAPYIAEGYVVVAAGFMTHNKKTGHAECWGMSSSLIVHSRNERDSELIKDKLLAE